MKSQVVASILVFLALHFCSPVQALVKSDWWEIASLYQIYPRSFKDSDGDGIGDLKGITSKMEYLKEIGVTATWLSPIFQSPMYDFGYDISNFTRIDPLFGTLTDFDEMIAKAKHLGIKVLLDFVPNHSSDECVWFQKSIKREIGFEDFYVWHDGKGDKQNSSKRQPPNNWISVFGGSMWTWHDERQQFYLHQFQAKQPDLNFSNPVVRQHMLGVLGYWLDRGVDGFRIDAVPHLFEQRFDNGHYPDEPISGWSSDPNSYTYHNHIYTKDQPATIELMYEWREFLEQYQRKNGGDTRILLGEAYSSIEILSLLAGNGTHRGAHLPMNFNLMYLNGYSTAKDVEKSCNGWMGTIWKTHQTANWVIGNHDNIRVANRFGRQKIDLFNVIVQSLPGAAVTYYGEEIGMSNVPTKCTATSCDNRDPERSPMQWNPTANAGFSKGNSTWLPIAEDYYIYNVETEQQTARSSLQVYKELQKLKESKAFKNFKENGGFSFKALTEQIFQVIRAAVDEEYMILVNLGNNLEHLDNLSNRTYEYVVLTSRSTHRKGDRVNLSGRIYLRPFEAVVLRWFK